MNVILKEPKRLKDLLACASCSYSRENGVVQLVLGSSEQICAIVTIRARLVTLTKVNGVGDGSKWIIGCNRFFGYDRIMVQRNLNWLILSLLAVSGCAAPSTRSNCLGSASVPVGRSSS